MAACCACQDGATMLDDSVIRAVFERLDTDANGVLGVRAGVHLWLPLVWVLGSGPCALLWADGCAQAGDVRRALRMLNMPSNDASLKYFLKKLDKNHDNVVSYAEFAAFVMLHDEALNKVWRTFHDDTHPNPKEFRAAMRKLNVKLSKEQAKRLYSEILSNSDSSFTDFCSVLMLLPENHGAEMLMAWLDETGFDTGDEIRVPPSGGGRAMPAWKLLVSGLVAGFISRTATAPMDRMKVMLQAQSGSAHSSVMSTCRFIFKEGGVLAFWRGNGVNCMKIGPEVLPPPYCRARAPCWL